MKYDYLIVGAGLFGSVFAYEAKKMGKRVLVIDKREHLGGNVYNEEVEGINIHKYGPHIFHTNDKKIWNYVNQFAEFNRYTNSPLAFYREKLYNLPFNMNTFYQIWGTKTPDEARQKIQQQINESGISNPKNLEEQAILLVGRDIYEILIRGYTEKQWGIKPTELPPFIIKRLPVRFNFDNNYFNDKYQGVPIGGYNKIINALLDGIEAKAGVDYFENKNMWDSVAKKVVFTGSIDQYFNYEFGELEYRSLKFENEILDTNNFQGNAVVNYTDIQVPYTRIIEHKHFEFGKQSKTVITREYSEKWDKRKEAYYPINNEENNKRYARYSKKAACIKNTIFGGRLAEYKYYDMHQVIGSALKKVNLELTNNN